MNKQEKFNQLLKLSYREDQDDIWLQNSLTLRRFVGILGILLPFLLWFFLWIYSGHYEVLESISHYYYTRVDGIFIISISLVAIFLIIYKGKDTIDFVLSFIAGVCALIVLLFPTDPIIHAYPEAQYFYSNTILDDNTTRQIIHFAAAGIFLFILAIMSIFLFTKSNQPKANLGAKKRWRNRIYRFCGIGMILAMLVIILAAVGIIDKAFYDENQLTFWMETVAVELFGISWLTKGETFLKDKNPIINHTDSVNTLD